MDHWNCNAFSMAVDAAEIASILRIGQERHSKFQRKALIKEIFAVSKNIEKHGENYRTARIWDSSIAREVSFLPAVDLGRKKSSDLW